MSNNSNARMPSKECLLAYETGVHLGDGCLHINREHRTHRIEFSGDAVNDKEFYSQIMPKMLQTLYGRKPKIYMKKGEQTITVVLNSKQVAELKLKLGLPSGNKLNLTELPVWIRGDLIKHFIRGLADSDFSLTFKKNRKGVHCEPRLELFTNNKILAEFVYGNLLGLGFRPTLEDAIRRGFKEYRIRMYGKRMLAKWMETIGFENPKHLAKVSFFNEHGFCLPIKRKIL